MQTLTVNVCQSERKNSSALFTGAREYIFRCLLTFALALVLVQLGAATVVKIRKAIQQGPNKYFVVFSSRPVDPLHGSLAGHAFVAWGIENSEGQFSWETSYGYYPRKGLGVLGSVPGKIVEEDIVKSVGRADQTLIVEISKKTFESSTALRSAWADHDPGYKLADSDCVTFTDSIARDIGLSVPKDRAETVLPQTYLHQLIELNQPKSSFLDLLPNSPRPSPSPMDKEAGSAGSQTTDTSISTGMKTIRNVTPTALRDLYQSLKFAEDHPETHVDIVVSIQGDTLSDVNIFTTVMRVDSVLKNGDSACLYLKIDGASASSIDTVGMLGDFNRVLSLRYSDPTGLATGLGINAAHPMISSAAHWTTAPTDRPLCYTWLGQSSDVGRLPEVPEIRYLSPLLMVSKARFPKDESVFNPNSPFVLPHSREIPNESSTEQLWREYRNDIGTLQRIASVRSDSYVGLSAKEVSRRNSFRQQSSDDGNQAFDYHRLLSDSESGWEAAQSNRFSTMQVKMQARNDQINHRLAQVRSANVAKYPAMAWSGYPDAILEANRQAMIKAVGRTRGLDKSLDAGGAMSTTSGGGGGSTAGAGTTGNQAGPATGTVEVPIVGPSGSCDPDVEMCVYEYHPQ